MCSLFGIELIYRIIAHFSTKIFFFVTKSRQCISDSTGKNVTADKYSWFVLYIVFRLSLTVIFIYATGGYVALCFRTRTNLLASVTVEWKFAWCVTISASKA